MPKKTLLLKDVLRIQMLCGNLEQEALGQYVAAPTCIDDIISDLYRAKVWLRKNEKKVLSVASGGIEPPCQPGWCLEDGICVVCPSAKTSAYEGAKIRKPRPGTLMRAGVKGAGKGDKHPRTHSRTE